MRRLTGREVVYTNFDEITPANVMEALGECNVTHLRNSNDIKFLFNYYRGLQPIYNRRKMVRPDICYNSVVNHASEIVSFKVSYLLGDPVVYVARKEGVSEGLRKFNDFMYLAGQQAADKELADDFTICGVAYRFVYVNEKYDGTNSPFIIQTLDPQNTFVAYRRSSSRTPEPVFAVTGVRRKNGQTAYDMFTCDMHYVLVGGEIEMSEPNLIGEIPIVEYVNNSFRIGGFEPVIDLLNDANALESNRIEAAEQNVQALTWFNDVDLDDEALEELKANPSAFIFTRTLKGQTAPNIKTILTDLQQQDQQVLQNDLYKKILTIVGMPSMSDGNSNDSSNNGSTIVRNGWQHAEARAKDTAILWERSDKVFLKIALKICEDMGQGCGISEADIIGKFTRRNYEDIMTKATVLNTLLSNDKVHPEFAYMASGLASDPEEACNMGLEWFKEHKDDRNRAVSGSSTADQRRTNRWQSGGTENREGLSDTDTSGT